MATKDSLPAFGAQLLVSTLDGRMQQDRLITARMSDLYRGNSASDSIVAQSINTVELHRDTNSVIYETWKSIEGSGTPYNQIEALIQDISDLQQVDEEAFLIVLSDGSFNEQDRNGNSILPDAATFRNRLSDLKQQLNGPLQAFFVLMGPNSLVHNTDFTVSEAVEKQGIRRALLEVMNGDPNTGKIDVSSANDLTQAFQAIIAKVASTALYGLERYITHRGDQIVIDAPLAVRRIVSVSMADSDEVSISRPVDQSFSVTDTFTINSAMRKRDTDGGWASVKLRAETTHFLMSPALPAGSHTLTYDSSAESVFLLFQSAVDLRQKIVDESNREFPKNNFGNYEIPRNAKASLVLNIIDESDTGSTAASFEDLDDLDLSTHVQQRSGTQKITEWNFDQTDALASIDTSALGEQTFTSSMVLKGFVSAYSIPAKIDVVDIASEMTASITGFSPCKNCQSDQVRAVLSTETSDHDMATIEIEIDAPRPGAVSIQSKTLTEGLSVTSDEGPLDSRPVREGPNTMNLEVALSGNASELLRNTGGKLVFSVEIRSEEGISGSLTKQFEIILDEPQGRLAYTGHSKDPAGESVLNFSINELAQGSENMSFLLYDALYNQSDSLEQDIKNSITFDTGHTFLSVAEVRATDIASGSDGGYPVNLTLTSRFLCGCFIFLFDQGDHALKATWTSSSGRKTSTATAEYNIDIPLRNAGIIECAKLLGAILLVLYILVALSRWLRAQQFPRSSGFDVQYNKEDPIFRELHRYNWTLFKALAWPIFGVPNEVRTFEGLKLVAQKGGADILLQKSDQSCLIESLGDTIKQIREDNPKLETYKLGWGDRVERRGLGEQLELTLLRSVDDRH
jgi:hypothetical protein